MKHAAEKPGECREVYLLIGYSDYLSGNKDVKSVEQPRTEQCNPDDWCAYVSFDPEINKRKHNGEKCNGNGEGNKDGVEVPAKKKILQFTLAFIFLNLRHLVRIDLVVYSTEIQTEKIKEKRNYTYDTGDPDYSVGDVIFFKVQHT